MTKGFRTFQPVQNTWGTALYFPTQTSFIHDWEKDINTVQAQFRGTTPAQRAQLLRQIHQELVASKAQIEAIYCQESGLSKLRFEGEFLRLITTIELFAATIEHSSWTKQTVVVNEGKTLTKKRLAIGPVLVLGSSNFPLAYSTAGGDTIAALAAGCCVVLKAHPMHVGTSLMVAECITRALVAQQLPTLIFSHLIDNTYHWASVMVKHQYIKAVGFTGSIKGGRALMDLAAQRPDPIPVFAEMGSLNPVILGPEIQMDQLPEIAQKLAGSVGTDAGQFCTKPGLILVPNTLLASLKAHLIQEICKVPEQVMLHPDIFQKFEARKRQVFQVKGIQIEQSTAPINGLTARWGLAYANLEQLSNESTLLEEVFGPFAVLSSFETYAELEPLFNSLGGQLTCSIFTKEPNTLDPFIQTFVAQKVGRVVINGVPTGVSVVEAMHHGGAYPAASDPRFSAVGPDSLLRFTKEISWQVHH